MISLQKNNITNIFLLQNIWYRLGVFKRLLILNIFGSSLTLQYYQTTRKACMWTGNVQFAMGETDVS